MRVVISLLLLAILSSCVTVPKPIYYWGAYEDLSYKAVKGNEEADFQKLMVSFTDIAKNTAKGSSGKIPPGICGDFGFFLMRQGKTQEGKQWLLKEKALYPESTIFIDSILKMAEK